MAEGSENRQGSLAWIAPVLWAGVIFAFSLTADPGSGVDPWFVRLASPVLHAGEFMVFAVLLAAVPTRQRPALWVIGLGLGLLVALADEFLIQAMMPQRVSDVWDIVADIAGLSVGLFIAPHVKRLWPHVRYGALLIFFISMLRFL